MKKIAKKGLCILLAIFCILFLALGGLTLYHHIMLAVENGKIAPIGKMVAVNGHTMHVAASGEREDRPTIVMLSGSGTAAPAYDFKVLYQRLSADYRVVVIERSGYGYSETSGAPRDVHTVMEETRSALGHAGEEGPYILMPHSMGGIEALYYAQTHPEEVCGIIGLDMTVPQAGDNIPKVPFADFLLGAAGFVGLQRLPFFYPIEYVDLTEGEKEQAAYLTYRNAFGLDVRNEIALTHKNMELVDAKRLQGLPILAFVSADEESRREHRAFAEEVDCAIVELDAPHYIHRSESETIAKLTKGFIEGLFASSGP